MAGVRRVLILGIALFLALGTLVFAPSARAWEFHLNGQWDWTYEYYTQTGRAGFFGTYDIDTVPFLSPFGFSQAANFWYGVPRINTHSFASGCDAAALYSYLTLRPEVVVNRAVRLRGEYRVGGWNDQFNSQYVDKTNSYYLAGTAVGTKVAMAEGEWTLGWATVQTPWAAVVYGKRPKPFGVGLQYDGDTVASESLLLRTDYGPLAIGLGVFPYRQSPPARSYELSLFFIGFGSGTNLVNRMDKSLTPEQDLEGFVLYREGPLEVGLFSAYSSYHQGGEFNAFLVSVDEGGARVFEDGTLFHGSTHVKYFNGRFFFNAEAAWVYGTKRQNTNFNDELGGLLGQFYNGKTYIEQWQYMVETGLLAGPAKLSFLYAFTPGLDRRNGILIDRQQSPMLRETLLTRELAGVAVWKPYAYIMPYMYNAGLPAMVDLTGLSQLGLLFIGSAGTSFPSRLDSANKEGHMLDASVLAARFDYAVASNLNLFASVFYAQRVSDGYGWGCILPIPGISLLATGDNRLGEVIVIPNYNNQSPTIPDKSLGYEVMTGFEWKLIENWNLSFLVSRWQPGRWFSYACKDRSQPNWPLQNDAGTFFGTRPGKAIDPIWAIATSLSVDF